MNQMTPIASTSALREGKGIKVTVDGEDIALYLIGGQLYAVGNHCPHQHHSSLHEGILDGTVVTCPMHGWSFDLQSGQCVNGAGRLKRFKVTVEGDKIFLEPPER